MKETVLNLVADAKTKGVSERRFCEIWGIRRDRIQRWKRWMRTHRGLNDSPPGPREATHRLLNDEVTEIVKMAKEEDTADLSTAVLAYTGQSKGRFIVSPSSIWRVLRNYGLATARRPVVRRAGMPEREELTGPNQRWCWDITFLRTHVRNVFLYLYVILDEWSRKEIAWCVSWHLRWSEVVRVFDQAVLSERLLDVPEEQRPVLINDRGAQMKAKGTRQFFADLHLEQRFSRPRTPDDNPFIEASFRTLKMRPDYPGRFHDDSESEIWCANFFSWYNHEHLHKSIGYITPVDAHEGRGPQILAERQRQYKLARARRLRLNAQAQKTAERVVGFLSSRYQSGRKIDYI